MAPAIWRIQLKCMKFYQMELYITDDSSFKKKNRYSLEYSFSYSDYNFMRVCVWGKSFFLYIFHSYICEMLWITIDAD